VGETHGRSTTYHALGRRQDSNAALAGLVAKHSTDAACQIAEVYAYRESPIKPLNGWRMPTNRETPDCLRSIAILC
jgi:hypothetical protein